jgi:hypothetical protein
MSRSRQTLVQRSSKTRRLALCLLQLVTYPLLQQRLLAQQRARVPLPRRALQLH